MNNRTKPTALITGNHLSNEEKEKRQEVEEKLKGSVNDILDIPNYLDDEAKEVYKRTLNIIGPDGSDLVSDADKEYLTTYSMAISILKQSAQSIQDDGLITDGRPNPAVKIFENYSKVVKSFSSSFGLDPFSRSKLALSKKDDSIGLDSVLEDVEDMFK